VKWEYKLAIVHLPVKLHDKVLEQDLAALGDNGWEAVTSWTQDGLFAGQVMREAVVLFKRPAPSGDGRVG